MIIIKDPTTLTPDLMPFIVLANSNDFVAEAIDFRTDLGGYHPCDHAMTAVHQGKFCSQGGTYSEVPMTDYMIKGSWLAFVQLVNSNDNFVQAYLQAVETHLALPWWKKLYNWPQIFGQAIGVADLSFPGLFDCSMIDTYLLKQAAKWLPEADQAVINGMSSYLNPEQLWKIINDNQNVFSIYGIYQYSSLPASVV
jgi:hypothetical protein